MPGPSAAALLDLWEQAEGLGPVERAVALAAMAAREDEADVASLPLGRRDALLLRLHGELAGPRLEATATCPACDEAVELALDVRELLAGEDDAPAVEPLSAEGFAVGWRPPDSRDVAAAAAAGDETAAEAVLLARCVLSASGPGGEIAGEDLPPAVRAALAGAMSEADPLAEVLVELECPACGRGFAADVEPAGFAWAEVRSRALRLLADVDALARAYGWTEADVLSLGEERRATYLALASEAAR